MLQEEKIKADQEFIKIKNQKKIESLSVTKRDQQRVQKEIYSYYEQKQNMREQLVQDVKEALKEDQEKKKELSFLRKMDQEENYLRSKNFHEMYKQKLVEKISEKKERADKIKEQ